MRSFSEDRQVITGINITPFVDIVLVILIIFMVTAPLIHGRAVKVDLPRSAQHEKTSAQALSLVFSARREIVLAGKDVSAEELGGPVDIATADLSFIGLGKVLAALRGANVLLPGGYISQGKQELGISTRAEFTNVEQIRDVVVGGQE